MLSIEVILVPSLEVVKYTPFKLLTLLNIFFKEISFEWISNLTVFESSKLKLYVFEYFFLSLPTYIAKSKFFSNSSDKIFISPWFTSYMHVIFPKTSSGIGPSSSSSFLSSFSPSLPLPCSPFSPLFNINIIIIVTAIIIPKLAAPHIIIWLRSFFFLSASKPAKLESISPEIGVIVSPSSSIYSFLLDMTFLILFLLN